MQLLRVFFVPNETDSCNQKCAGTDIYLVFAVLKILLLQICRFVFCIHPVTCLAGNLYNVRYELSSTFIKSKNILNALENE